MAIRPETEVREVYGVDEPNMELIKAYIKGAVYCWCKNCPGESFAAHDLFGGDNADWDRTPIQELYNKHRNAGKDHDVAYEDAAKDLGWILKKVLSEDENRLFLIEDGYCKSYRWERK